METRKKLSADVQHSLVLLVLLLFPASVFSSSYRRSATCSPSQQNSLWSSMLSCAPRPTVVALSLPSSVTGGSSDNSIMQLMPGHVVVDRCSGSCHGPSHSCHSVRSDNVTVEVMALQTSFSGGVWNTACGASVAVERHLECRCGCAVREEHCDAEKQVHDAAGCRCRCRDTAAKIECLAGGTGKQWNEGTCSCVCPRSSLRVCSTGFVYDFRICACARTSTMASGGIAIMVAVAALTFAAITTMVCRIKRRREIFSNRSSFSRRQQFAEVFLEGSSGGGGNTG